DETGITITGSGWGNGVGLSQYGARAMADGGDSASQILSHYYPGVELRTVGNLLLGSFFLDDDAPVWVGLLQDQTEVTFHIEGGSAELCFDTTGQCVATATEGEKWKFGPDGSGGCAFSRQPGLGWWTGDYIRFDPPGGCSASARPAATATTIRIPKKGRSYRRGTLRFRESPTSGGLHLVAQLGVEDYVRGIQELPDSWPGAALEAQAIASRTLIVREVLANGAAEDFDTSRLDLCGCHILDNNPDQVYGGFTAEEGHPFWQGRVGGTSGQVLTWNNAVILAKFTSSTGGRTESNEAAGGPAYPYLESVDDSISLSSAAANPFSEWTTALDQDQIASLLGYTWLSNARVTTRNESGSVATVVLNGVIAGRPAERTITGAALRDALGLYSPSFSISVTPRFADVLVGHQFAGEILGLSELGITTGCTADLFCPGNEVTREEMAAFLVRARGLESEAGADPFVDDDGSYFEDQIETLYHHGITTGCTPTKFCPADPVTREEMAAFITRAFGLVIPDGVTDPFVDDDGSYFEDQIETLHHHGITTGCTPTRFCPTDLVTREQMAAFIIRALSVS
ncbi:MAG: SpoIID/LytB domain-containing protein, partial [Acidimicrobiales bacterium]|nr:SpoIID/LytB domain-containing protein [Acidimicrobiales bacterium]